jgi:hypothetical protein
MNVGDFQVRFIRQGEAINGTMRTAAGKFGAVRSRRGDIGQTDGVEVISVGNVDRCTFAN